jgi:hypothetical protein
MAVSITAGVMIVMTGSLYGRRIGVDCGYALSASSVRSYKKSDLVGAGARREN